MHERTHRWIRKLACLLMVVAICFFSFQAVALAQDGTEEDSSDTIQPTVDTGKGAVQFDTIGSLIYDGLTSIGGLVISLGAKILDFTLSAFVYDMHGTMEKFNLLTVVSEIWELVRDLFNLFFIFGLIFIGFKIILDVNDRQSKTTLVYLLIAALLINFSLYITQVVIDFSNIAAAEIGAQFDTPVRSTVFTIEIRDISSGFIAAADLENIGSTTISKVNELATGRKELITSKLGAGSALALGLSIALMFIVIGIVFAFGAIIMFARFMYLIFLMMFSPVMFLGWVLPQFSDLTSFWWQKLFNNAFVGPAYLFMLFIALRALQRLMESQVMSGDVGITAFMVSCLLVAAFAWGALLIARRMGDVTAKTAVSLGSSFGKGAQRMTTNLLKSTAGGTTGLIGRTTIGKWADRRNQAYEERGVLNTSLRSRLTANLAGRKFGGGVSAKQVREAEEKAAIKKARREQLYGKPEGERTGILRRRQMKGGALETIRVGGADQATAAQQADAQRAVSRLTNEQMIEVLASHKSADPEYLQIVRTMSDKQYEAVMKVKPEELNDTIKTDITEKRDQFLKATADAAAAARVEKVAQAQAQAAALNPSEFAEAMSGGDYNPAEREQIRKAHNQGLIRNFTADPAGFFASANLKEREMAKLPKEILLSPQTSPYLTPITLRHILNNEDLTPPERAIIRINVNASGTDQTKNWIQKTSEGRLF